MKHKYDVQIIFPKFKSLIKNFHKQQIKKLYTDNGGEYIGLRSFLSNHGISHHTTPPHTPENNGISERQNRHVVEIGLALLHHSGLPLTYWPHAMTTASYPINLLPTLILMYQSPYFKLHNISPNELAHITHPSAPSSPMLNDLVTPLNNSRSPHKLPVSSTNPLKHLHPLHQTPIRSPKTFKCPRPRPQHPMNWPTSLHRQRLHHRPHPLLAHTKTSHPTSVG